ncbi:MAG: hypothetical protein ACOCQ1_04880 [Halanaerobiaceae bacterium]
MNFRQGGKKRLKIALVHKKYTTHGGTVFCRMMKIYYRVME